MTETESRVSRVEEMDPLLLSGCYVACISVGAFTALMFTALALAYYGPDLKPLPGPRATATAWAHAEAERAEAYRQLLLEMTADRPDMEVFREQIRQERIQSLIRRHQHECAVARADDRPMPPLPPELQMKEIR